MGARISKPPPHRIEPDETGVEVFQDATPEISTNPKRQKGDTAPSSGTTHVVRSILHDQPPLTNGSEIDSKPAESLTKEKKKRRRSKKEKNKLPPPKLVRAQTQLNELKNVKPLLQSPQVRQQHYEQIKDAYALDEEAKKAPSSDARARLFSFENWRKLPQTPSGKGDLPTPNATPTLTHSQLSGVQRALFASSGRSSRGTEEIEDLDDSRDLGDIESIPLPPATRTSAITAPTITTTPNFLAVSNQVDRIRPDVQTTPVIRVRTSDRRTPERSKRSFRSDLRLDDVDEDLMEHILTDDSR